MRLSETVIVSLIEQFCLLFNEHSTRRSIGVADWPSLIVRVSDWLGLSTVIPDGQGLNVGIADWLHC